MQSIQKIKTEISICYLCGKKFDENISKDHIPPKQFYAGCIRQTHSPNLLTLPTHKSCNTAYQLDEDYFVHSLGPLALGSYSGNAILRDIDHQMKRPQGYGKRIGQMILKEFDRRPGGIILPHSKVAKRFDGKRIWRIIWKITRGLYFHEKGQFLPEKTPRLFDIVSPGDKPSSELSYVLRTPSRGQHPGVFDYKFMNIPEINNMHLWSMLLWDRIIIFIAFHDPECPCSKCKDVRFDQSNA